LTNNAHSSLNLTVEHWSCLEKFDEIAGCFREENHRSDRNLSNSRTSDYINEEPEMPDVDFDDYWL
jgi:hypothetical protein